MKIRFLRGICFTILILAVAICSAFPQQKKASISWVGEYLFEISEPKTAGGDLPTIEYRIQVSVKNAVLNGKITADGYQTDDRYICKVKMVGEDKIEFYFVKDATIPGEPARNSYKKDSLLGSLSRRTSGKDKFLYTAGGYEIYPPAFAAEHPVIFKKIK